MGVAFFIGFVILFCIGAFLLAGLVIGICLIDHGHDVREMEDVEEGKRIIFKGKILVTISSFCISAILLWWGLSKLEDARKEENFIVYAAENDDYEKLEELLESGAPADANHYRLFGGNTETSSRTNTALCVATLAQNDEMIELLLEYGASPDKEGLTGTPFIEAMYNSDYETLELFFEYGVDANYTTIDGNSYLAHACLWGDAKVVEMLLEHGSDPNVQDCDGYYLLEYEEIYYPSNVYNLDYEDTRNHEKIIQLLKEYGAIEQ